MTENIKPTKEEALIGLKNPLDEPLKSQGITADYLTQKLKEELDANETKVFSGAKGVIYSKDMIAWSVRQKARQDAHKLRGDYPSEKQDHRHFFDPDNPPKWIVEVVDAKKQGEEEQS